MGTLELSPGEIGTLLAVLENYQEEKIIYVKSTEHVLNDIVDKVRKLADEI